MCSNNCARDIENLQKCLENGFKIADNLKKRKRTLLFKHLFYVKGLTITQGYGYPIATSHLIKDSNIQISFQAVQNAWQKINPQFIEEITNSVLKLRPFSTHQRRFLAVDASWLAVNKKIVINNSSYSLTNTGSYAQPLLTAIYDIKNRVPLKLLCTKEHNERAAFLQCLDSVKKGDCLTFDRGYPSAPIIKILKEYGLDFIFRLKESSKMIKNPPDGTRIVSYKVKNTNYFLLTSLKIGQFDDEIMKDFYHDRWKVEEWFKYLKCYLGGNFYSHGLNSTLLLELQFQQLWSVIMGYLKLIAPYKNAKGCLSFADKIVKYLSFSNPKRAIKLNRLITHIEKTLKTKPRPGRSFDRKANQNRGVWYLAKSKLRKKAVS